MIKKSNLFSKWTLIVWELYRYVWSVDYLPYYWNIDLSQGWLFYKTFAWMIIEYTWKFCRACRKYVGKSI